MNRFVGASKQKGSRIIVRHSDLSSIQNSGWQILGELELPTGECTDTKMKMWLMEVLHPLQLPLDFMNKISIFAQDAVTRALQVDNSILRKWSNIRLTAFAPAQITSTGSPWGFFQIEKVEHPSSDTSFPVRAIELYLYLEGK
jgi:hypothetical protein